MFWQLPVPGTQTVTVTNTPFTYPTGDPPEPVGPRSTTILATLPAAEAMVFPPGSALPPLPSLPQLAAANAETMQTRGLRTRELPLPDVGRLHAGRDQVRRVRPAVEGARMPAHLHHQPGRRRRERA